MTDRVGQVIEVRDPVLVGHTDLAVEHEIASQLRDAGERRRELIRHVVAVAALQPQAPRADERETRWPSGLISCSHPALEGGSEALERTCGSMREGIGAARAPLG